MTRTIETKIVPIAAIYIILTAKLFAYSDRTVPTNSATSAHTEIICFLYFLRSSLLQRKQIRYESLVLKEQY